MRISKITRCINCERREKFVLHLCNTGSCFRQILRRRRRLLLPTVKKFSRSTFLIPNHWLSNISRYGYPIIAKERKREREEKLSKKKRTKARYVVCCFGSRGEVIRSSLPSFHPPVAADEGYAARY